MKELLGVSAGFRMEFKQGDEVRSTHDTETCDCCGSEKTTIISIPFSYFITNDGEIHTEIEQQNIPVDSVWAAEGSVRNDKTSIDIPHLSLHVLDEDGTEKLLHQLLTLTDSILRQVDETQEFTADVAGIDSGSIDYDFDDAADAGISVGALGITNPILPTDAQVCSDHGIAFRSRFADGEFESCCDESTITYEIQDTDRGRIRELNESIQEQLTRSVGEELEMIENPYDESGIIPTESLVPFLYKHRGDGVEVWDALHEYLFARQGELSYHPTLDLPDEAAEAIEDAGISRAEYLEIGFDLFETLRWECPIVGTDEQTRMLKEQFPELYQSRVDDPPAWQVMTPVWEDVFKQDELDGLSDTGTLPSTYRDAYSGGHTYQYDEEKLVDSLEKDHLLLPGEVFANYYRFDFDGYSEGVDVVCSVDKTAYVPDVDERYLEDEADPMLPRAAWITPHFIVLREDAQISLSKLQELAREMGSRELDRRPMTDEGLQSTEQVVGDIPTELGPQSSSIVERITFDQHDLDDAPTGTLDGYVDSIGDVAPAEERETIVTPYTESEYGVERDGEYWQTGLTISEFPISHGTERRDVLQQTVEEEDYFVDFSLNIYSPDGVENDSLFYGPRVKWETILPDDFDATSTDEPKAAIQRHIDESDYDTDDTMYMFALSAPITTEGSIRTADIEF